MFSLGDNKGGTLYYNGEMRKLRRCVSHYDWNIKDIPRKCSEVSKAFQVMLAFAEPFRSMTSER